MGKSFIFLQVTSRDTTDYVLTHELTSKNLANNIQKLNVDKYSVQNINKN